MRKNTPLFFLLLAGMFLCSAPLYAVESGGVGSANVKFGNPDKEGNCAGKGICMLSSLGSSKVELPVSFTYVPALSGEGFSTLSIQFSVDAMEKIDRDYLFTYFLHPDGRPRYDYRFDREYVITNTQLCEALGIEPGQVSIKPTDESRIDLIFNVDVRVTYRLQGR
jgi:hypothetical protein